LQTSPEGVIRSGEIWKRFRREQRFPGVRDEFRRLTRKLRGEPAPGWFWALRDVDFEVNPGSSVGLVGVNGSGKSTLLKILTRVMYPTAGRVEVGGRVGALIEVRAGIHPELTGRENVFLTGSLMGLSRRRIAERFDEIVAFAELEHAIDRQVKYFSSGMQMRLGFGVAAFLEPDVLLVDEVLAVGDASFQQRCLERMRQVLSQGTTLVLVSHDLASVEATCERGLWLHDGTIKQDGPVREVLSAYRSSFESDAELSTRRDGRLRLEHVETRAADGMTRTNEPLEIAFRLSGEEENQAWVYVGVSEGTASPIFVLNPGREVLLPPGETDFSVNIARLPLPRGRYYIWVAAYKGWTNGAELLGWQPVTHVDVHGPELDAAPRAVVRLAPLYVESSWEIAPS
jgi:ABC-type polysaccharide/polyol phosphate transport system ATPase subunit